MEELKFLPEGMASFEKLRTEPFIYVDKTDLIYKFTKEKQFVFLSRPRRFGKSLLVSTLQAYFKGRRELFEGLKISSLEQEWKKYPVIHFDFSNTEYSLKEDLTIAIDKQLRPYEEIYLRDDKDVYVSNRFDTLIRNVYKQTGEQVVILVDEYDTPLLECPPKYLDAYKKTYSAFFKSLKTLENYIRFAFITGVTKFSQVSIFSSLNNLSDITLSKKYSTLCGITQEELLKYFSPYIEELAKENNLTFEECLTQLKDMYDGYHFCEDSLGVYNPYSLINCFADCKFNYYWFETVTPTFLVKKLITDNYDFSTFSSGIKIDCTSILSYEGENYNVVALLYQAGYLTIKSYNPNAEYYTLVYPNREVQRAFVKLSRPLFFKKDSVRINNDVFNIIEAIDNCDIENLINALKTLFSSISYTTIPITEEVFRNYIHIVFTALGQDVRCEEHTSIGRIDLTLLTKKYIYIIEIKKDKDAKEALKQINENCYADKYALDERKVIKIGINFSSKIRNIDGYEIG